MTEKQINESKTAAASYILTFYQEVGNLTNTFSQYFNLLMEFIAKYSNSNKEIKGEELKTIRQKMTEDERAALVNAAQNTRSCCTKCYIMYKTMITGLKIKEDKNITDIYHKLRNDYIIDIKLLETFTLSLNSVLVNEVIKDLVDNSAALMENFSPKNG